MLGILLTAALTRLIPHPPNFTPIAAIALFGGAHLERKLWAFLTPLLIMLISDIGFELLSGIGFHRQMPAVYISFAAIVCMGFGLRSRRRISRIAMTTFMASTLFFIVTNFSVWVLDALYPKNLLGLTACYTAALPFFGNQMAGDIFYTALLFGAWALAQRRFPIFASTH